MTSVIQVIQMRRFDKSLGREKTSNLEIKLDIILIKP